MTRRTLTLTLMLFVAGLPALRGQSPIPPTQLKTSYSYLQNIPVPGVTADEMFVPPAAVDLADWREAMNLALADDFAGAHGYATTQGYQVIDLEDNRSHEHYFVFRETADPGEADYRGLGYYVFFPAATNELVIEAPHPRFDLYTKKEAVKLFLGTGARALHVAGIHRRNSTVGSSCTDGRYFISDAAHWDTSFFQVAHTARVDANANAVTLQLHGYGSPDTEQFILSEGYAAQPSAGSFAARLEHHLEQGEGYEVRVFPTETDRLGGTWNVQGRYSNGEIGDPCGTSATAASGTFVHIEQIKDVRKGPSKFIRAVQATVAEQWP